MCSTTLIPISAPLFEETIKTAGVTPIKLPACSQNLNAHAERWVKSIKKEALSKLILFGEGALRKVLNQYATYYHQERNHQGKGLLVPPSSDGHSEGQLIRARERLVGC